LARTRTREKQSRKKFKLHETGTASTEVQTLRQAAHDAALNAPKMVAMARLQERAAADGMMRCAGE
jgi:hypothetical protein